MDETVLMGPIFQLSHVSAGEYFVGECNDRVAT
jgi:hypothetical protein